MNRILTTLAVTASALALAGTAQAQNLTIANARIITGVGGRIIDKGSVVVKDGKIVAVTEGASKAPAKGAGKVINASGMTVIAGYIDDHRHIIHGERGPAGAAKFMKDDAAREMMELLESGVTTVQSGGDSPAVFDLRSKVASGEIKGPRIIASAQVPVSKMKDEATVRAAIDKAIADYKPDSIAEVHFPITEPPSTNIPTEQETRNLAAGIDEALKFHVPFQVHTSAPGAMTAALKAGAKKLVHTPHFGWLTDDEAKQVVTAHAWVSSCTGFGVPVFGVFNHNNVPTFRDGSKWPDDILNGEGRGREAGYKAVNGRTLWDNGVDYGYCTDTNYYAPAALAHELRTLNLMFSPIDMVKILGQNSADFIDMGDKLGTIETGKLADIVILGANPMDGYWNFLTAEVVIKGGVVMVDKRGKPNAGKPIVHNP